MGGRTVVGYGMADGAAADRCLAAFAGAVAGDIALDAGRPYPQPEALDLGIPEAPLSRARLRRIDGPLGEIDDCHSILRRVSPILQGKPAEGNRRNQPETGGNTCSA